MRLPTHFLSVRGDGLLLLVRFDGHAVVAVCDAQTSAMRTTKLKRVFARVIVVVCAVLS
jgi:hypothetical protein